MAYSIYDIAKISGVSVSTVSKALSGSKEISEATREKIKKIAEEIGYIPNASARAIAKNKNNLVGLLFSDDLNINIEHPFFSSIIRHFKDQLEKLGYDTIFISSYIGNKKYSYLDHCRYRNIDGVYIVTFSVIDTNIYELIKGGIPCVATDMEQSLGIPIAMSNNNQGLYLSIEHLVKLGHKKIGNIAGYIDKNYIARERLNAFRDNMNKFDLEIYEKYIITANNYNFESGYEAAMKIIQRNNGDLPSAFIVVSDIVALGAIKAFQECGYKVPDDISIIGFDDLYISSISSPSLTTIKQDTKKIGLKVAELLINKIEGKEVEHNNLLDVELIVRESTTTVNHNR